MMKSKNNYKRVYYSNGVCDIGVSSVHAEQVLRKKCFEKKNELTQDHHG